MEPVGDVRAKSEVALQRWRVAIFRFAVLDPALGPVVLGIEDKVDDTRNRVRAIGRRSAAGHDLDTLDESLRNDVGIGRALIIRRRQTLAVEQHKVAKRPQIAQVEIIACRRPVAEAAGGKVRTRTCELRQLVQGFRDRARACALQLHGRNGRDRRWGCKAARDNARPGNDDFVGASCFVAGGRAFRIVCVYRIAGCNFIRSLRLRVRISGK